MRKDRKKNMLVIEKKSSATLNPKIITKKYFGFAPVESHVEEDYFVYSED